MESVFDAIKDRLPITDVLSTYLTLIPAGTQFKAKCPFHNERTASFSISPDRGLYYCFGCGAKGDIFTFVEQFEGLDKKGALKVLADRAGIVLTKADRTNSDPLYDILEETTTRYQHELKRHPEVLEYAHTRGILPQTIETFRIGYAPDQWRFIANLLQAPAIGERAGLVKKAEKSDGTSGYYDRFRKRLMFPLADSSGRIVGFSGRLFPDGEGPKYLNSPETELFQKSRILFPFDKAKAAIRQHNFAILVEGQIDAVLAHQAGFRNTVASSGTAVSEASAADPSANLAVLARLTPNLFLAFDGDAAGQKALEHAAVVALGLGMNPKVVPLPEGKDPADYIVEHGAEGWKALLKESKHFILHELDRIRAREMSPHVLVATLKDRLFPFLVRVQSPVERGSYVDAIAKELDLRREDVTREFELYTQGRPPERKIEESAATASPESVTLEERFLALCNRYDSQNSQQARLQGLRFEDHSFTFSPITSERMIALLVIIERDYGDLSPEERNALIDELAGKLEEQFFAKLRHAYSRELEKVAIDDEARATELLTKLQALNQHRHGG